MQAKTKLRVLIIILLSCLISVTAVYAAFVGFFDFSGLGNTDGLTITQSGSFTNSTFTTPGEMRSNTITITNNNKMPVSYSIVFALPQNDILSRTLTLYVDGKEIGNLAVLASGGTNNKFFVEMPYPLYVGETVSHTLALEFHIGASEIYKNLSVSMLTSVQAKSLSVDNFVFVESERQLRQTLQNGKLKNRTIVLLNNITLNALTAINMANIDLNGKTLSLNGNLTFNSTDSGVYKIYSSKSGGSFGGTGAVILSSQNALLLSDYNLTIASCSLDLLQLQFENYLLSVLSPHIDSNVTLGGGFVNYLSTSLIGFSINQHNFSDHDTSVSYALNYSSGTKTFLVQRDDLTRTVSVLVNIGADNTRDFAVTTQVLGTNTLVELEAVLTENLPQLTYYSPLGADTYQSVTADLFLPIIAKDRTATIQWFSSDETVLDSFGRIKTSMPAQVVLTAIVTLNNAIIRYDYYLDVSPSVSSIKSWFELEYGLIFYELNEVKQLPSQIDKLFGDIIITSIAFDDPVLTKEGGESLSDYFVLDNDTLAWTVYTSEEKAYLPYTLTLSNGNTIEGYLTILLHGSPSVDVFNIAYEKLVELITFGEGYLENGLLMYGEILLGEEENAVAVSVVYSIDQTIETSLSGTIVNPNGISKMAVVLPKNPNYQLVLNPYFFPQYDTTGYITATVTFKENAQAEPITRVFALPFPIVGILHHSEEDISDFQLYYNLLNYKVGSEYPFSEEITVTVPLLDSTGNYILDNNGDVMTYLKTERFITMRKILSGNQTSIYLTNKGIKSLKGLEYFTKITNLDLPRNELSDLSILAQMPQLTRLNLHGNKITSLEHLKHLVLLKELDVSANRISSIADLENMRSLEMLFIQDNANISDYYTLRYLVKLRTLYAYGTVGTGTEYPYNQNFIVTSYRNAMANYGYADYRIITFTQQINVSGTDELINDILNAIVPSYQFENVLYLPFSVVYKGVSYSIEWGVPYDVDKKIVEIVGNTVTIHQPAAAVDVRLTATIRVSGSPYIRVFDVLALASTSQYKIVTLSGEKDAKVEIPDDALRQALFTLYDTDGNKTITQAEINGVANNNVILLTGLGINDLKGIEHFTGITSLNLSDNNITDYSKLASLVNLTSLTINGTPDVKTLYTALINTAGLRVLNLDGCTNLDTPEFKEFMRRLMRIRPNLKIYIDNSNVAFDPFAELTTQALSNLKSYYLVYPGETKQLDTYSNSYVIASTLGLGLNDEVYEVDLAYNRTEGPFFYYNNTVGLYANTILAVDDYGNLLATLTLKYGGTAIATGKRTILVIALAPKVYLDDGTALDVAIKSEPLRKIALSKAYFDTPTQRYIVTAASLKTFTSLSIGCFDGVSLHGINYFTGLTSIEIVNYRNLIGQPSLAEQLAPLTALRTLTFRNSIVKLHELYSLSYISLITKLDIQNCVYVEFEYASRNILSYMTSLESLTIINCNINDFSFLQGFNSNHKCREILAYSNPASTAKVSEYYMGLAYDKLQQNYKGTDGSGNYNYNYKIFSSSVMYVPDKLGNITFTYTTAGTTYQSLSTTSYANYITTSSTLSLPATTDNGYPIIWTCNKPQVISISGNTATITSASANYRWSYVIINGYVEALTTTKQYYFLITSTGAHPSGAMSLDKFVYRDGSVDKFYDALFANTIFSMLSGYNDRGVFESGSGNYWNSVTMIIISGSTGETAGQTVIKDTLGFSSIRGIDTFTTLTYLDLGKQGVPDIEPISRLVNLTRLHLDYTIASTFADANGNSYFTNLTKLAHLQIRYMQNVSNYLPIVYNNYKAANPTTRTGLSSLTTIYSNCGYGTFNYQDPGKKYFDTLKIWYNAIKDRTWAIITPWTSPDIELRNPRDIAEFLCTWETLINYKFVANATTGTLITSFDVSAYYNSSTENRNNYNTYYSSKLGALTTTNPGAKTITWEAFDPSVSVNGYNYTINSGFVGADVDMPIKVVFPYWDSYSSVTKNGGVFSIMQIRLVAHTTKGWIQLDRYGSSTPGGAGWVRSEVAIPDPILRARLFTAYDIGDNFASTGSFTPDGNISYTERIFNNAHNYWLQTMYMDWYRVTDITGIDYFPTVYDWGFSESLVSFVPVLDFAGKAYGATINFRSLNLNYCRNLSDISGIVSVKNYITILQLEGTSIDSSCFQYLSQLTKLNQLRLNDMYFSDFNGMNMLPSSITNLIIRKKGYSNFNQNEIDNIRKFFLNSTKQTYDFTTVLGFGGSNNETTSTNAIFGMYFIQNLVAFARAYEPGVLTALPGSIMIADKKYYLTYSKIAGQPYTISADGKSITVNAGYNGMFDVTINIISGGNTSGFISYTEKVSLLAGTGGVTVESVEMSLDGWIQLTDAAGQLPPQYTPSLVGTEGGANYRLLSAYVKDEMLRAYLFEIADINKDGIISFTERTRITSFTFTNGSRTITDFTGIEATVGSLQMFPNLISLNVSNFNTRNLDPIYGLSGLTSLRLDPTQTYWEPLTFFHLDGMSKLQNLTSLDIYWIYFIDLNFLTEMPKLTTITIKADVWDAFSIRTVNTIFNRVTAGFVIINNGGGSLTALLNRPNPITEQEKLAGYIFSEYESFISANTFTNGGSYSLNDKAFYNGVAYEVVFETLSTSLSFANNKMLITARDGRTWGAFVARIKINGVVYEKYIKVSW